MARAVFLSLIINCLVFSTGFAGTDCFIVKRDGHIMQKNGDCAIQHPPCSTFKIAISLMGYNEGILIDATHPEFPYQSDYTADFGPFVMDAWKTGKDN